MSIKNSWIFHPQEKIDILSEFKFVFILKAFIICYKLSFVPFKFIDEKQQRVYFLLLIVYLADFLFISSSVCWNIFCKNGYKVTVDNRVTLITRPFPCHLRKIAFSQESEFVTYISRMKEIIPDISVLIWMYFSWGIQISS